MECIITYNQLIKNMTKTPITWYGGKQMMLKHILPIIPSHRIYVESFFGGGAVFFAKEPVKCEVINDLNKEAINFYQVCANKFPQLQREVTSTLHSHSAFKDAKIIYTHPHLFDPVKRAWAFHTTVIQSFSSNTSTFAFDRQGTTRLKVHNKRLQFTEELKQRLENVTVECDDALKVINRYDTPDTFHYVDPPYFNSNCGHYAGYTENDFKLLLERLSTVQGKFLLSSYPSDLLSSFQTQFKWYTKSIEKPIAVSSKAKGNKIEVLTANYPI